MSYGTNSAELVEAGHEGPHSVRGHRRQILEAHAEWLLELVEGRPDLTLEEIRAGLRARGVNVCIGTVWNFYDRRGISFKKSMHASEQDRADVAAARALWKAHQGLLDPTRLVFIDESVLQSTEGVQHELKPFVKLRERWGRAPRDRLSGAGLKPVRAAAVKSRGGERRIKSSDQTEQVSVRKANESEPSEDASL